MEAPINSVDDLAKQTKIKYGCLQSGSTNSFFKDSTTEVYQKLHRVMSENEDEVMVTSNKDGIDKVIMEQGSYAFFMESTTIEYVIERHCNLQQIGGLLDSKSYGIAVQQGKKKFSGQLFISQNSFFSFRIGLKQICSNFKDSFFLRS